MADLNIGSTTVEKGLDLAKEFLGKLLGPAVEEFGGIMGDGVKKLRLSLQLKNVNKVKALCEKHGIAPNKVNLKVLYPYLEAVSLEEDEDMQDVWANLMTNYLDSSKNLTSTVYPSILAQLSTEDLLLLNEVWLKFREGFCVFDLQLKRVSNLERLGVVHVGYITEYDIEAMHGNSNSQVTITAFGAGFIQACRRD